MITRASTRRNGSNSNKEPPGEKGSKGGANKKDRQPVGLLTQDAAESLLLINQEELQITPAKVVELNDDNDDEVIDKDEVEVVGWQKKGQPRAPFRLTPQEKEEAERIWQADEVDPKVKVEFEDKCIKRHYKELKAKAAEQVQEELKSTQKDDPPDDSQPEAPLQEEQQPQQSQQEQRQQPPASQGSQQRKIVNPYAKKTKKTDDDLLKHAKILSDNPNHGGLYGKDGAKFAEAEDSSVSYAKKKKQNHDRFVNIVKEATAPKPGETAEQQDETLKVLHTMFTTVVDLEDGIKKDLQFYKVVSGEKSTLKQVYLNAALNIWTTKIKNKRNKEALDTSTHKTYIKMLFASMHDRGVKYEPTDFSYKGGFQAVCKLDWNQKKAIDPTIGTKRNKAEYDEDCNQKYMNCLNQGKYKPYDNSHDLLTVMAVEMGRRLAFRGNDEIVKFKWEYLRMGTKESGPMKGLRYLKAAPQGGFDKTHQLSFKNPTTTEQHPELVEDPNNKWCLVKLVYHYRSKCSPHQKRFFCHVNTHKKKRFDFFANKPVGGDKIREWSREFAHMAGFKDADKFTPHDFRHQCITNLASDPNVTVQARMNQARHRSAMSGLPYIHKNAQTEVAVQQALQNGVNMKPPPKPTVAVTEMKPKPQEPLKVTIESKPNILNAAMEMNKENAPENLIAVKKALFNPYAKSFNSMTTSNNNSLPSKREFEFTQAVEKAKKDAKRAKKEVATLEADCEKKQGTINELQCLVNNLKNEVKATTENFLSERKKMEEATKNIETLKRDSKDKDASILTLIRDKEALTSDLRAHQHEIDGLKTKSIELKSSLKEAQDANMKADIMEKMYTREIQQKDKEYERICRQNDQLATRQQCNMM